MDKLKKLLEKITSQGSMISSTLSNKKKGGDAAFNKVTVKPFIAKEKQKYQFSYIFDKNTTHKNMEPEEAVDEILGLLENYFKQGVIFAVDGDYQLLVNKKNEVKIIKNKSTKTQEKDLTHNRKKNYVIEEGKHCDFLYKLGVMDAEGKVYKNKYDKFRQINKYLEIIEDSIKNLDMKKKLKIVDFGSGKAYLTFALYWYLREKMGIEVEIIGLDLKVDVINYCNEVSEELGYKNLSFKIGDIKGFKDYTNIDIVITLHACDIATDDAIIKAVNWNTKLILLVPCCQHELFRQVSNEKMSPILKHGILKERLSSIITDSIRGNILEILGYSVEIFEFIDTEHTPKNLVIRAVNNNLPSKKAKSEYYEFKKIWNIDPYLEKSLKSKIDLI
ncbi:SAM-dependent methyltransferase [uncultured Ilyobacter sp.]|uniref:class I SAM-dependent methyltransferase n=1 Tax=uncultured Ilyobacter sp. TaxID=544433 RepID=UPI0029C959D6|nr:SAM-dependent methyltransferase [uncultured Ilyobacter sp.]